MAKGGPQLARRTRRAAPRGWGAVLTRPRREPRHVDRPASYARSFPATQATHGTARTVLPSRLPTRRGVCDVSAVDTTSVRAVPCVAGYELVASGPGH
eukprot:6224438-Prymnesium_polylepis.1